MALRIAFLTKYSIGSSQHCVDAETGLEAGQTNAATKGLQQRQMEEFRPGEPWLDDQGVLIQVESLPLQNPARSRRFSSLYE